MDRLDSDLEHLNQAGQARGLPGRQLENQPSQRAGVNHRVFQRAGESAAQDPAVECVVAVLDKHGATGEMEEGAPGISELGCVDEHLAADQVAPLGVGIDRGAGVNQGVEEAQRASQPKPLGADLEHQEGTVPGGFDVHGDELRIHQARAGIEGVELVSGDRLPGDGLEGAAWLELQYAFLWVKTRNSVIRMIFRSNARLQFSM